MPVRNQEHTSDWLQWLDSDCLTAEQKGWEGSTRDPWGDETIPCAVSEVVWKNPHPEKTISHLDVASELSGLVPFIVAVSLE